MVSIPQRLIALPSVRTYYAGPGLVLLSKQLSEPIVSRPSYVALHALGCVLEGSQRIETPDGEGISLGLGKVSLIPKGLYTVTDLLTKEGVFQSVLLFFEDAFLKEAIAYFGLTVEKPAGLPGPFALPYSQTSYPATFHQSLSQLSEAAPLPSFLAKAKALEFLGFFLSQNPQLGTHLAQLAHPPLRNLPQFMQAHFDKPLTVEDYAALTGRSVSTFQREFKSKFGTSPKRWIIAQRMKKANQLLQRPGQQVGDIALAVGYENVSHFIKAYKGTYGHTPGQERQGNL